MNKKRTKIKKRKKLRVKFLLKALLIISFVVFSYIYISNLTIKNIYIKGNTLTKDYEIIEKAGIQNYPKLYKINKKNTRNKIKELPLIEKVKIKRNILGKITIEVEESKILFFYKYNEKYITTTGSSIESKSNYYGYPTLINFTPDTILEKLVTGLNKIDFDIILMINEIEYDPYKSNDGTMIDESRFKLKMNDQNTVVIDTINIKKLNDYKTIYTSLNMDTTKGFLYLDTITEDKIYFKSYETAEKEQEEAEKLKENEENQEVNE